MQIKPWLEQALDQAGNLNKPLLDPTLPQGNKPALQLPLEKALTGSFGDGRWNARANISAALAIFVFTSANDKDEDAVFGAPTATDSTKPRPLLHPAPGKAFLKCTLDGDVDARASTKSGAAKVTLSGSGSVGLGAYCMVSSATDLKTAIASLSGGVPFILNADDVKALAIGDACYTAIGGTLSAKLELNWADVLSGPIGPLQGLLPKGQPVNFAIDAKAAMSVELSISDSFRLVFVGRDANRIGLRLDRASSNAFSIKGDASVAVRLEKPEIVRDLLTSLMAQLFGTTPEHIGRLRGALEAVLNAYDDALDKIHAIIGDATQTLDSALDGHGLPLVITRLGQLQTLISLVAIKDPALARKLGVPVDKLDAIAKQLDSLAGELQGRLGTKLDELLAALGLPAPMPKPLAKLSALLDRISKIEGAILEMAKKRIELGLNFEYRRLAIDATLLSCILDREHADFETWHRAAVKLDVARLLQAAEHPGVELELFLHQKSIRRSFSLGLDLGSFYSTKNTSSREWIDTERILPGPDKTRGLQIQRRHVLKGFTSRTDSVFGTKSLWRGDFDADFLSTGETAKQGRWRFALALTFSSSSEKAEANWLRGAADYAALWGVVPEPEVESLAARLLDSGALGQPTKIEVAYTLCHAAFASRKFLEAFAQLGEADLLQALAAALPRSEAFAERRDISKRRKTYARAVSVLLGKQGDLRNPELIATFVKRTLIEASADLRAFEGLVRPAPNLGSVADTAKRTGSLLGMIREFKNASDLLSLLGDSSTGNDSEKARVIKALAGWDLAWQDRYPLRWQVALLRALAAQTRLPHGASTSRLKLTIGAKDKKLVQIFVPGAELGP